jgi:hypothetical protein
MSNQTADLIAYNGKIATQNGQRARPSPFSTASFSPLEQIAK